MASDQIHHHQAIFPDHDHDMTGYSALFANPADPSFDQHAAHWNIDSATHHQHGSLPQSWQPRLSATTSTSSSNSRPHHVSAVNSTYDQFFHRSFSDSPNSFPPAFANIHGNVQPHYSEAALDPALVAASNNASVSTYSTPHPQPGTVSPAALQAQSANPSDHNVPPKFASSQPANSTANNTAFSQPSATPVVNPPLLRPNFAKSPNGVVSGSFLIIDFDDLCKKTQTKKLSTFLNIGDIPQDIATNRTTIPSYQKRKSRNEIRRLAGGDEKLMDKIAQKPKKSRSVEIKVKRPLKPLTGPKEEVGVSSSEDYSDSSDSDSSDDDAVEESPLPKTRPDRPVEAVRYDTINAVWLPRRSTVQASQIRNALTQFWEVIRTIRDRWKADSAIVKEAEEAKKASELPLLKERVRSQREMMEMALKTAIEHGHPEVIRLLGEHVHFIFVMYQFLAERVRELDYKSSLACAAIEILSLATAVSNEVLEKTKMSKVLTLFGKRGDEQTQTRIKLILENAEKSSRAKGISGTPTKALEDKDKESKAKAAEPNSINKNDTLRKPAIEAVAGIKRPRSSDTASVQPAKRVISNSGTAVKAANDPKAAGIQQKRSASGASDKPAATPVIKQKVVVKPTSLFSGLQSASKKPSATTKIAAPARPEKKAAAAAPGATSKSSFSFADTMANLLKPKEPEPSAKAEEQRPPETEEERSKRIRKEERRKLRVRFRPDISLCAIRYFTHDPEEEMGHDASMVRDAGDVHNEGHMFKQHKDMMDVDEDEDQPSEESFREWALPSSINFDTVDLDERKRNYEPYGGGMLQPECPEREAQKRREASILMVFYSHASDIPPSPKEPQEDVPEVPKAPIEFGTPAEPTMSRAARFMPKPPPSAQLNPSTSTPPPATAPDVTSLLSMLVPAPIPQQQTQQAPTAPPASSFDALEKLFGSVATAPSAPAPVPSAPPVQQPTPPQSNNLSAILASLQQFQVAQPQQQPQQPQQPQQAPAMPWNSVPTTTASMPNADQLIATALQHLGMPQLPGFNYGNMQQSQQSTQYNQQQLSQQLPSGPYEDPERKRMRDGSADQTDASQNKRRKWNENDQGAKNPSINKNHNPPKFVVPCRFWKEGKCKKGDDCTFLHT